MKLSARILVVVFFLAGCAEQHRPVDFVVDTTQDADILHVVDFEEAPEDSDIQGDSDIGDVETVDDSDVVNDSDVVEFDATVCVDEEWPDAEFIRIQAGTFMMGSPDGESGRHVNEMQHEVTLTNDFLVQATEVTQCQFYRVMGYDPTTEPECFGDCPVGNVSWNDAALYANFLSIDEGLPICYECGAASIPCILDPRYESPYECTGYRLPTEAEWEYAARAGTSTATYNGDLPPSQLECESPNDVLSPIAWSCSTAPVRGSAQPVALLRSNGWGLFDMLGNRAEAVHDWHEPYPAGMSITDPFGATSGTQRIYRGGDSWAHARFSRAASRQAFAPDADLNLGFRVARTIHN